VPGVNSAGQDYPGDDGSADPAVAAALAAYAAGRGGELAALTALAASRLLVPVLAVRATAAPVADGPPAGDSAAGPAGGPGHGGKSAEMALPSVVGADGRLALPAFTCLDAMMRWRADARPVPVPAARVWQAAAQEASAAVIDIAGPVPLAVEGARLAALAAGQPPPPPHTDPDVLALARQVLAGEGTVISGFGLMAGGGNSDLRLAVRLAPGRTSGEPAVRAAAERAVTGIMAGSGGRFRRGIEVALSSGSPR
jgi:SseB protein N-terminal domain